MSRIVAVPEDSLAALAAEVKASRRALAGLLRRHRALRARLDGDGDRRCRRAPGPEPAAASNTVRYWVQRGAHTRRGTFTALLTPWPQTGAATGKAEGPEEPGVPARLKVETALDCWWSWRHPDMPAIIAGRRGLVVWLDFLDRQTGRPAEPFPAYAGRYQQARERFFSACRVAPES
jgi:hypothetical protein